MGVKAAFIGLAKTIETVIVSRRHSRGRGGYL
jgi:hypothetical protein